MKRKIICLLFIFPLIGINYLSAQITKSHIQDMYVTYLRSEGYYPSVDSDGDVNFTAHGHRFYIDVMENDLQSFRIVLTGFIDIGGSSKRLRAFEEASYVTRTTKAVRLFITASDRIAIDSFIFIANPEDFKIHLNRMVNIIISSRSEFLERMNR